MDQVILGNTLETWAIAAGVAVVAMVAVRLAARILISRLNAIAQKTATDLDDLFVSLLRRLKFLVVLMVGIWAGSLRLELSDTATMWIGRLLTLGFLVQAAIWASGTAIYFPDRYKERQVAIDPGSATAIGALGFLVRLVVWTVFGLSILVAFDKDITPLIASLGIGGLAVALALQTVLSDLFASLSIVLDKPFVIGDFIVVGEFKGTVEHVGLKTTRVKSLSGEQLIFSNSDLLSSRLRNFKRMAERRAVFTVGVLYSTPPELLREIPSIIRGVVEAQDNTRLDRTHFANFGDSSLNFETVYFMLVPDYNAYMDTQEAINLGIFEAFGERGIEFAFPTRTVILEGAVPGGS